MKFKDLTRKEQKLVIGISIMTVLLFLATGIVDHLPIKTTLERNTCGEGDKKEELEVTVGERLKEEPITVVVEEQKYTKKQQKQLLERCMKELDQLILGQNKSVDEVRHNLNLITSMPEDPVDIVWEVSDYDVMNVKGELVFKNLINQGTLVELRGTLSYEDTKMQYITNVNVYPPKKSGTEQVLTELQKQIKEASESNSWKSSFTLPDRFQGQPIRWNRGNEGRSIAMLLLGLILVGLIFAKHKQDMTEERKKKEKQMMLDYPEIINRFVLLIGAGMTVKSAWRKIVTDYQRGNQGQRYAYEEMAYTLREMQSGTTESESYERFGSRCGLQSYLKFGALLSQNLRKGTKGLTELLSLEAIQAFEERKALAKRLGEEAGTKLLMPMFLMLAVVLIIVIVPAFLSMQI